MFARRLLPVIAMIVVFALPSCVARQSSQDAPGQLVANSKRNSISRTTCKEFSEAIQKGQERGQKDAVSTPMAMLAGRAAFLQGHDLYGSDHITDVGLGFLNFCQFQPRRTVGEYMETIRYNTKLEDKKTISLLKAPCKTLIDLGKESDKTALFMTLGWLSGYADIAYGKKGKFVEGILGYCAAKPDARLGQYIDQVIAESKIQ